MQPGSVPLFSVAPTVLGSSPTPGSLFLLALCSRVRLGMGSFGKRPLSFHFLSIDISPDAFGPLLLPVGVARSLSSLLLSWTLGLFQVIICFSDGQQLARISGGSLSHHLQPSPLNGKGRGLNLECSACNTHALLLGTRPSLNKCTLY